MEIPSVKDLSLADPVDHEEPNPINSDLTPRMLLHHQISGSDLNNLAQIPSSEMIRSAVEERKIHQDFFEFMTCFWISLEYCASWYESDAISLPGFHNLFCKLALQTRNDANDFQTYCTNILNLDIRTDKVIKADHLIPVHGKDDLLFGILLTLNLSVMANDWLRKLCLCSDFKSPETSKRLLTMFSSRFRTLEKFLRDLHQRIQLVTTEPGNHVAEPDSKIGWYLLDKQIKF